ncbi:hypothetical protein [Thalassotalea sp. PLHSN55]|uniref:hypothetical protein n=1 Tax=Thalassotalea sp. PLHSN55 TaxID=3435888 RepID=UPI003F87E379
MNKLLLIFIILMSPEVWALAQSEDPIVIVVNANNPTKLMNRSEVIDIFMGKYVAFPNGEKAVAIDLDSEQETKRRFYQLLVGRSLPSINAYWSRIRFSGRMRASLQQANEASVISSIEENVTAIGYIPKSMLNKNLKIVYELHE